MTTERRACCIVVDMDMCTSSCRQHVVWVFLAGGSRFEAFESLPRRLTNPWPSEGAMSGRGTAGVGSPGVRSPAMGFSVRQGAVLFEVGLVSLRGAPLRALWGARPTHDATGP